MAMRQDDLPFVAELDEIGVTQLVVGDWIVGHPAPTTVLVKILARVRFSVHVHQQLGGQADALPGQKPSERAGLTPPPPPSGA
jgi:hypothetical protein